mmetsp:Transcript_10424/g.21084  ORF Transcript_10424/g.21084 Transcript_10424/m.21084 type:complete len:108 (+) Transcript_10424:227-550(+)
MARLGTEAEDCFEGGRDGADGAVAKLGCLPLTRGEALAPVETLGFLLLVRCETLKLGCLLLIRGDMLAVPSCELRRPTSPWSWQAAQTRNECPARRQRQQKKKLASP